MASVLKGPEALAGGLPPSPPSQIDPNELMQALKQERTAKAILNKDSVDLGRKQRNKNANIGSSGVEGKQPSDARSSESSLSPREAGQPADTTPEAKEAAVVGAGKPLLKEERPLFEPGEVESLTAYLVESQQAASLINVADIQHGESFKNPPV